MNEDEIWAVTKITASDEMPELEDGEIAIGDVAWDQCYIQYDEPRLKKVLRKCRCFRPSYIGPVTLYWKWGKDKQAAESMCIQFDTESEMLSYLKKNRPLVYTLTYVKPFDRYMARVFSTNGEVFSYKWYDKLYEVVGIKLGRR